MTKEATKASTETQMVRPNAVVQGKVVVGRKPKLSPEEQGQLARGEIDAAGEVTAKGEKAAEEAAATAGDLRTVKPTETVYQGWMTGKAIAASTGEPVSNRWYQAEPAPKDGCFHSFRQYYPSAKRETFELDLENKTDPTLRTYLER